MGKKRYKKKNPYSGIYVPAEKYSNAMKVIQGVPADIRHKFVLIKEENIPDSGIVDEVGHVFFGQGLLSYKRMLDKGEVIDRDIHERLTNYLRTIVSSPEKLDFSNPNLIEKIISGEISLPRIGPANWNAWKEEQEAKLAAMRSL